MAKMLPPLGKFVDVQLRMTDTRYLVECGDCKAELILRSKVFATSVDKPDYFTVTHNFLCPVCGGMAHIALNGEVTSA